MTRPRIGFLGTGWIGRHRMQAIVDTGLVEAVAVSDPSADCVAQAQAIAPGAAIVPSLQAMLDLGLDGVVIASPSALHAAQSLEALGRGVAVFCQKPLGRDAGEVSAVVDSAQAADRLLGVDLSYRHTAATQAMAGPIRSGELGEIYAVDLTFHNAYGPDKPWFYDRKQSGGGCVIDLGVHLIDLALWMLDFPAVEHVTARLFAGGVPLSQASDRVEDFATARLDLATGAAVQLACSWNLPAGRDAVIEAAFYGTKGAVTFRNVDGSFYDLAAFRHNGTQAQPIASPPDDWGTRAAAAWAQQLAGSNRFDPQAARLLDVAQVLDRIYAAE